MKHIAGFLACLLFSLSAYAQRGTAVSQGTPFIPTCTAITGSCPASNYVCVSGTSLYRCALPATWTQIAGAAGASAFSDLSGTATDAQIPNTITIDLAATATALAANPSDCAANQFANAIAASGNLTCAALADADIPNTITVDTATVAAALAANPAACSAGQFVTDIAANGTLTCDTPSGSGDVLDVGNCTGGACFDGTSDGGYSITFYNVAGNAVLSWDGTTLNSSKPISITDQGDGNRSSTFADNTSEPSAPADTTPDSTLLYSLGGELYKKDEGDSTNERLLLNSGNVTGDITVAANGASTIGAAKVTAANLKAVDSGNDEECLTRETTTGDFEWQACGSGAAVTSNPGSEVPTGRWQNAATLGRCMNASFSNIALSANVMILYPVYIDRATTVSNIAIEVQTAGAGGTLARVGVYTSAATTGLPETLVTNSDVGTVAVDTTGVKTFAVTDFSLSAATWYWLAIVSDGAPTLRMRPGTSCVALWPTGDGSNGGNYNATYSHTFAALPSPLTAGSVGFSSLGLPHIALQTP